MFLGWDGSGRWREFETFGVREGLGLSGVWEGSGRWREFETFGVREGLGRSGCIGVRRIGCGAHRSWRIREPAAARQCVLSELEPKGSDKTSCLAAYRFAAYSLLLGCGRVAWRGLVCWWVGRGKQKARSGWTGLYGLKILRFAQDDSEALRMIVRCSG